jgi:U-box domain
MLYIVRDTTAYRRRDVASKVLQVLNGLASQELSSKLQRLDELKSRVTWGFYRAQVEAQESDITKSRTYIAGLNVHKQPLVDFLLYRAIDFENLDDKWTWTLGNTIPKISKQSSNSASTPLDKERFAVPDEFICPISREVMDDPVISSDGFTFERTAIER